MWQAALTFITMVCCLFFHCGKSNQKRKAQDGPKAESNAQQTSIGQRKTHGTLKEKRQQSQDGSQAPQRVSSEQQQPEAIQLERQRSYTVLFTDRPEPQLEKEGGELRHQPQLVVDLQQMAVGFPVDDLSIVYNKYQATEEQLAFGQAVIIQQRSKIEENSFQREP